MVKIADNVKFKTTAVKAVEVTDKDVDLAKTGDYEAEAKITIKEGVDKTRKMAVRVYDKALLMYLDNYRSVIVEIMSI